jgi:GNAT superfamily N-acetyltransferase
VVTIWEIGVTAGGLETVDLFTVLSGYTVSWGPAPDPGGVPGSRIAVGVGGPGGNMVGTEHVAMPEECMTEPDVRPGTPDLEVRIIAPRDWRRLRELRLRALADSPAAFLEDERPEADAPDAWWRARCRHGVWFAASTGRPDGPDRADGRGVGLARIVDYPDEDPRFHLEGMWVSPDRRREGIGQRLLEFAEQYLGQRQVRRLALWVVQGNAAAGLYVSRGYRPTGREGCLPGGRQETEYARELDRS